MSSVDWDGETYARVSTPQLAWGEETLARLELDGDETVLDAGCGAGRVTKLLLDRLPRGRVIGVDASPAMIEQARALLGDAVELRVADLLELELDEPVDVVFSTATFHWIPDHPALFARLFAALRPGGRLVAQYGGEGNVAECVAAVKDVATRAPFAEHLQPWSSPWRFASAEDAAAELGGVGFTEVRTWLEQRDAEPEDMRGFLASSVIPVQLDRLPAELREQFTDAVLEELGHPDRLHYVRLNVEARRPEQA